MNQRAYVLVFAGSLLVIAGCGARHSEQKIDAKPTITQATPELIPDEPRDRYNNAFAVVIGVENYDEKAGLGQLAFAANDAKAIREILVSEFGYLPDNVRLLIDREATHSAIEDTLTEWLPNHCKNRYDSVLFFFSGHGLRSGERDGLIAPVNTDKTDLQATTIPVALVVEELSELPCLHKAIILDSCYSGRLLTQDRSSSQVESVDIGSARSQLPTRGSEGGRQIDPIDLMLQRPAFVGLTAGRDTPVLDSGNGVNSVFTTVLLEVMRERANTPRDDHVFTFRKLAAEVEARVSNKPETIQIPDWGTLKAGSGDFIFRPVESQRRETPREISENRRFRDQKSRYSLELSRAQAIGKTDPSRAIALLQNTERFPLDLQGFGWRHLHHRCASQVKRVAIPGAVIRDVVFSDSQHALVAATTGAYKIELETGWVTGLPFAGSDLGSVFCVSPDGGLFAMELTVPQNIRVGERKSEIAVIDVAEWEHVRSFGQSEQHLVGLAFLDNETLIATYSDGRVDSWIAATGKHNDRKQYFENGLSCCTLSPDRQCLAAGYWNGRVDVAIAATGSSVSSTFTATKDDHWLHGIEYVDDENFVVFGAPLEIRGESQVCVLPDINDQVVREVSVSVDGRLIAVSGGDRVAKVYSLVNGQQIRSLTDPGERGIGGITCLKWSSNGQLAAGSLDGVVTVYSMQSIDSGPMFLARGDRIQCVAVSSSGRLVASGHQSGTVRLWDTQSRKFVRAYEGHEGLVLSLEFSPNDTAIVSRSLDTSARVWHIEESNGEHRLFAPRTGVLAARFLPDGEHLITTETDSASHIWSLKDGTMLRSVPEVDADVCSIADRNGEVLIAFKRGGYGEFHGTTGVWNLSSSSMSVSLDFRPAQLKYSADASRLWGVNEAEFIEWDTTTWRVLHRTKLEARTPASVPQTFYISRTGTTLLTTSDTTVELVDTRSGVPLFECDEVGDADRAQDAQFSPLEDKMIVPVGSDIYVLSGPVTGRQYSLTSAELSECAVIGLRFLSKDLLASVHADDVGSDISSRFGR